MSDETSKGLDCAYTARYQRVVLVLVFQCGFLEMSHSVAMSFQVQNVFIEDREIVCVCVCTCVLCVCVQCLCVCVCFCVCVIIVIWLARITSGQIWWFFECMGQKRYLCYILGLPSSTVNVFRFCVWLFFLFCFLGFDTFVFGTKLQDFFAFLIPEKSVNQDLLAFKNPSTRLMIESKTSHILVLARVLLAGYIFYYLLFLFTFLFKFYFFLFFNWQYVLNYFLCWWFLNSVAVCVCRLHCGLCLWFCVRFCVCVFVCLCLFVRLLNCYFNIFVYKFYFYFVIVEYCVCSCQSVLAAILWIVPLMTPIFCCLGQKVL